MTFLAFVPKVRVESLLKSYPQIDEDATCRQDFPLDHGPARNPPCPPLLKGGLGGISATGWPKKISCQVSRFFMFIAHAPNHVLLVGTTPILKVFCYKILSRPLNRLDYTLTSPRRKLLIWTGGGPQGARPGPYSLGVVDGGKQRRVPQPPSRPAVAGGIHRCFPERNRNPEQGHRPKSSSQIERSAVTRGDS